MRISSFSRIVSRDPKDEDVWLSGTRENCYFLFILHLKSGSEENFIGNHLDSPLILNTLLGIKFIADLINSLKYMKDLVATTATKNG